MIGEVGYGYGYDAGSGSSSSSSSSSSSTTTGGGGGRSARTSPTSFHEGGFYTSSYALPGAFGRGQLTSAAAAAVGTRGDDLGTPSNMVVDGGSAMSPPCEPRPPLLPTLPAVADASATPAPASMAWGAAPTAPRVFFTPVVEQQQQSVTASSLQHPQPEQQLLLLQQQGQQLQHQQQQQQQWFGGIGPPQQFQQQQLAGVIPNVPAAFTTPAVPNSGAANGSIFGSGAVDENTVVLGEGGVQGGGGRFLIFPSPQQNPPQSHSNVCCAVVLPNAATTSNMSSSSGGGDGGSGANELAGASSMAVYNSMVSQQAQQQAAPAFTTPALPGFAPSAYGVGQQQQQQIVAATQQQQQQQQIVAVTQQQQQQQQQTMAATQQQQQQQQPGVVPAVVVGDTEIMLPAQSFLQLHPLYPGLRKLWETPPLYVVDDFFTGPECDALMVLANNYMIASPVVGAGAGEVNASRTSSSCFLAREDLPTVCRKVMALTGKPIEHLELPQVGRYYTSQKYNNHWDAFDLNTEDGRRFAQNGGQRVCTVLVYLNDVASGGCTAFPQLGLKVHPKKGMAVVFFPATVGGVLDSRLLHAAEPAVDTKWVSQIWIRQGAYHGTPTARIPTI